MKYLVVLLDGAADMPVAELGNKTPLEAANKPCLDGLAERGEVGMVHITPDGCKGGSEVGNLSIMGYDPRKYLTGRSPLEAASIGIKMAEDDLALRFNLVCVSDDANYEEKTMIDYSSGEISTAEAAELVKTLNEAFKSDFMELYTGISYRHCLILHHATDKMSFTPPHNITGRVVRDYLPQGDYSEILLDMMKKSYDILKNHPVNIARREKGLREANSMWLWGQGRRMSLPSFMERFGKKGAVITAVDLVKGIARCADMKIYEVEGATGNLHSNFIGKGEAAIQAFKDGAEFVYVHIEAPDECGHQGDAEGKKRAIELIDEKIAAPVCEYLKNSGESFAVLAAPDHPTPLSTGAHSSADVPYMIYRSNKALSGGQFCESVCEKGELVKEGFELFDRLFSE